MTSRPKTFTFKTSVKWTVGLEAELTSAGKPLVAVTAAPEFLGVDGKWTPEDLFVAAVESCLLLSFLSLARTKRLQVISYESVAEGTLEYLTDRFIVSKVVVKPVILVGNEADKALAATLAVQAHERCFISNSIESDVQIKPTILVSRESSTKD